MTPGAVKLEPIPVARPWGGRALAARFGKPALPGGEPVGETWEASDVEGRVSRVATGPLRGAPLPDALGGPLPLLVKLLDCREILSLQVHPDEEAARALGAAARPKSEAWFVLEAAPDAYIYYGARPGVDTEALLDACARGAPEPLLRRVPLAEGDAVFCPAGTVHAIGPGLVIYEVQEPSDSTYRLHDWGRVGLDGRPRTLHLEEARASIRGPAREDPRRRAGGGPGGCGGGAPGLRSDARTTLVDAPAFRLDLVEVAPGAAADVAAGAGATFVTIIEGAGRVASALGQEDALAGETFALAPAGAARFAAHAGGRLRFLEAVARPQASASKDAAYGAPARKTRDA